MFEIKIFKVLNNHHILEKQSAIAVNFSSKQLLCSAFTGQNSAQKASRVHKTPWWLGHWWLLPGHLCSLQAIIWITRERVGVGGNESQQDMKDPGCYDVSLGEQGILGNTGREWAAPATCPACGLGKHHFRPRGTLSQPGCGKSPPRRDSEFKTYLDCPSKHNSFV